MELFLALALAGAAKCQASPMTDDVSSVEISHQQSSLATTLHQLLLQDLFLRNNFLSSHIVS